MLLKKIGSLLIILILAFIGLYEQASGNNSLSKQLEYRIRPTSKLGINGKTNINTFNCHSQEQFESKMLNFEVDHEQAAIFFQHTELRVNIDQLDCGINAINKDLKKALLAEEYPEIIINIKEVINTNCNTWITGQQWIDLNANTDITITCETRPATIPIQVSKTDEKSFRIIGETQIQLCDFAIQAPVAMLGMIKVKDEINIKFDLYVDII